MGNGCFVAHYCLFSTILLTATHWNIIKHELIFNVHEGKGLEHNHSLRFEIWLLKYCINLFGLTFTRVFQSWFGHQNTYEFNTFNQKNNPLFFPQLVLISSIQLIFLKRKIPIHFSHKEYM